MYVSVCVCMCVSMCMYVSVCMYVCECVYAHVGEGCRANLALHLTHRKLSIHASYDHFLPSLYIKFPSQHPLRTQSSFEV